MDDKGRHDQVAGALGRIEQKVDSYAASTDRLLHRHEEAIKDNRKSIGKLQEFQARTKGVALAVTIGVAALAGIASLVAKAKELF